MFHYGKSVITFFCYLVLAGCATVPDYGRLSDIKHAYLVRNEYLVVCLDGVLFGKEGEHYVELPLNGTFLHPLHVHRYFEPVIYQNVKIPQFRIPATMTREGCNPATIVGEHVSVPVVRDLFIDEPKLTIKKEYSEAEKREYQTNAAAAANSYEYKLKALDKSGTVYLVRRNARNVSPNFIYASEQPLYSYGKVVSFIPDPRDKTLVPSAREILLAPVVFAVLLPAATGITIANAIDHPNRGSSAPDASKSPEATKKPVLPPMTRGAIDNRLSGQWRTIEDIVRYRIDGSSFLLDNEVCVLKIVDDKMTSECSSHYGTYSREAWIYRLRAPGKYEFQILESENDKYVGLRGTADYDLTRERLTITTYFDNPYSAFDPNKTKTVYIRDLPRYNQQTTP